MPEDLPKIELDFSEEGSLNTSVPRRGRPVFNDQPVVSLPKIEPILKESDVGTDEAERTVGICLIISALPALLALLFGHGAGILAVFIPIVVGVGLIRGEAFAQRWMFAACLANLVISMVMALAFPHSILFALGGVAQYGGLLLLVSGRAISKVTYRLTLLVVLVGTLLGSLGATLH
jgi:hypothetical protein